MVDPWNKVLVDTAAGIHPLLASFALIVGLLILLTGWRISYFVAVLNFAVFGLVAGVVLFGSSEYVGWLAWWGAAAFGTAGLYLRQYSVTATCGAIGGICVLVIAALSGLPLLASIAVALLAFVLIVGASLVAHEQVAGVMLAVQGGLLTVFGLTGCLSETELVWPVVRDLFGTSGVAATVLIITPVLLGALLQLAAIQSEGRPTA